MEAFISLFSQYNVPAAFLVNIELTLWSALFSTILGVILVMMRISPVASLRITNAHAYQRRNAKQRERAEQANAR